MQANHQENYSEKRQTPSCGLSRRFGSGLRLWRTWSEKKNRIISPLITNYFVNLQHQTYISNNQTLRLWLHRQTNRLISN